MPIPFRSLGMGPHPRPQCSNKGPVPDAMAVDCGMVVTTGRASCSTATPCPKLQCCTHMAKGSMQLCKLPHGAFSVCRINGSVIGRDGTAVAAARRGARLERCHCSSHPLLQANVPPDEPELQYLPNLGPGMHTARLSWPFSGFVPLLHTHADVARAAVTPPVPSAACLQNSYLWSRPAQSTLCRFYQTRSHSPAAALLNTPQPPGDSLLVATAPSHAHRTCRAARSQTSVPQVRACSRLCKLSANARGVSCTRGRWLPFHSILPAPRPCAGA